jgi:hypothetical protein
MCYFATLSMKKTRQPYTVFQSISAVLMILALLWLTISLPYVYNNQQEMAKQECAGNIPIPLTENEEEANPLGNTTEEKAPNSLSSFSEEYLHDNHRSEYFFLIASQFHKCEKANTYVAFHGELLVPPPNRA